MVKTTETRAPVRAAKPPSARRRAASSGNGRAPRSPAENRRAAPAPAETAREPKVRKAATGSSPEAEPTRASSAPAPEASTAPVHAAAESGAKPLEPAASDGGADRPTGATSAVTADQRGGSAESARAPADRPATSRPDQTEVEPAAVPPPAGLEGSARLRDEVVGFARAQLEDAIATGQAILTCGSLPKALELQASYAARAMQGNVAQAVRLARLSAELMPAALMPRRPF